MRVRSAEVAPLGGTFRYSALVLLGERFDAGAGGVQSLRAINTETSRFCSTISLANRSFIKLAMTRASREKPARASQPSRSLRIAPAVWYRSVDRRVRRGLARERCSRPCL